MKIRFKAFTIFLVLIFNVVLPWCVFADEKITIFNCGERIEQAQAESNGGIYIPLSSLPNYDLKSESDGDAVRVCTYLKKAVVYRGSSIVEIENISFTYNKAIITKGKTEYISLDLIAMIFSPIFECENGEARLWITYYHDNYAKGVISLPSGETAPEGGVLVNVKAEKKIYDASGEKIYPSVGFDGLHFFEENYFDFSTEVLAEKTVLIKEGEARAEYFLSNSDKNFYNCEICFEVCGGGYEDKERIDFDKNSERLYNFAVAQGRQKLSGTIKLDESDLQETRFCVVAAGEKTYKYYGSIGAGKLSADYTFFAEGDDEYNISVVFEDKKYQRTSFSKSVAVCEKAVLGIDLTCKKSKITSVNISLPKSKTQDNNVSGYVFLQCAESPYYYLDVKPFNILAGETETTVCLTSDRGYEEVVCFYELKKDQSGLYDFGYYSPTGTRYNIKKSEDFVLGEDISIELLPSVDILAQISVEGGGNAEEDIWAKAFVEKHSDGYSMEVVDKNKTEEEGEEVYFPSFLKADEESGIMTVAAGEEAELNITTEENYVCLLKKGKSLKNVKIKIPADYGKADLRICGIKCGEVLYPDIYYNSKNGCTFSKNEATALDESLDEISVILKKSVQPTKNKAEISYKTDNSGKIYVSVKNQTDEELSDLNVYIAFYDDCGAVDFAKTENIKSIKSNASGEVCFRLSQEEVNNAKDIKCFALKQDLSPCSDSVCLKKNYLGKEQKSAYLWLKQGCKTYFAQKSEVNGETEPVLYNGVLAVGARQLGELIGAEVIYDSETKGITYKLGEKTALTDGFEICDRSYVFAEEVMQKLGFKTEVYNKGELFVFENAENDLIKSAKQREIFSDYLFEKQKETYITRYDMAQLLAPFCETAGAKELEASEEAFLDTNDVNVLKLKAAGIVKGTEEDVFSPQQYVTTEEFLNVLYRALVWLEELDNTADEEEYDYFYDNKDISVWARPYVYTVKKYGALDGVYNQIISSTDFMTVGKGVSVVENSLRLAYDLFFEDISPQNVHKKAAVYLAKQGIMNGYEDGSFKPDGNIMRGEFAALLTRTLGAEENLSDNGDFLCGDLNEHWCRKYAAYCVENGYMTLNGELFEPDKNITAKEVLEGLIKAMKLKCSSDFKETVSLAKSLGLLEDLNDINFSEEITRIKTARLIYNFLNTKE